MFSCTYHPLFHSASHDGHQAYGKKNQRFYLSILQSYIRLIYKKKPNALRKTDYLNINNILFAMHDAYPITFLLLIKNFECL